MPPGPGCDCAHAPCVHDVAEQRARAERAEAALAAAEGRIALMSDALRRAIDGTLRDVAFIESIEDEADCRTARANIADWKAILDEPAQPGRDERFEAFAADCAKPDEADFSARVEAVVAPLIAPAVLRAVVESLSRVHKAWCAPEGFAVGMVKEIGRARRGEKVGW